MDKKGFLSFLEVRELPESEIANSIQLALKFESFLEQKDHGVDTKANVNAFSVELVERGENTIENYYALARYGRFIKNWDIYVGVVELLDGCEAFDNLYQKTDAVLGTDRRDLVFQRVKLPPIGTPNQEKVMVAQQVLPRLVEIADASECQDILADCLRDLEESWFQDDVKLFQECQNLDEFLDKNAQNFIASLEVIRDEDGIFFNQKITDDVVEFVRSEPLIARGVREGDILYEVKIPHMTVEFLAESDPQMKRYYYCHCPWVKEALKGEDADIPSVFCTCSAGFHKKRWEAILGQPLQAEIVESVLNGDDRCMIAIQLPDGFH